MDGVVMPNWVYNSLHCHGSKADLDTLQEFLRMEIRINKWDKETRTDYYEMEPVEFTYMAIRNPFSPPYNVSQDEYYGTNGFVDGQRLGNTDGNWYNWNSTHWGVKWDACRGSVERQDELLSYHFESPWGPPWEEMMLQLSEQFPTVAFTHRYDEEQGWGGEYEFQNGEISNLEEWDIPTSHADAQALDQTCSCEMWTDDPDMWYDDCPAKIEHSAKELADA
jgi:hypothetical protein